MRERLSRLAGLVAAAVQRRGAALPAEAAAGLAAVVAAFEADYGPPAADGPAADGAAVEDRLSALAEVFGLDGTDQDLLAVAVAADLDANFGVAYDLLGRAGGLPTVALALELAGLPTATADAFDRLDDSSALRRGRLAEVSGDGAWLRRQLRVPRRVSAFLAGSDRPDPAVAAIAVAAAPFACPAAGVLARAVGAGAPLTWVRAPLGTAGLAAAVAAFAELGVDVLAVDAGRADPAALAETLAAAAREAGLAGAGLVVTGADPVAANAAAFDVLVAAPVPVIAVSPRAWSPALLWYVPLSVDAPPLAAGDRAGSWTAALGMPAEDLPAGDPGERAHLALSALRLAPEQIVATATYARRLAAARDESLTVATVRDAARLLGGAGGAHGRPTGPAATFDDLVLPDRVLGELRRLVRWSAHRDEVLARGPVHGKGGKGSGITALFTGGPGTGKTLAAHVIADELNLELLQVELSSVVDKYIGETEKNLERIFHDAESRNVVLFFDEADALFGSRSEVRDARDRYANQEVSYLLQRMEHFDGITVLATNLRGNLDAAFSRRMQFVVHFPDPDEPTRRRLWDAHLRHCGPLDAGDPVDADALATTVELSGGDIRNIVLGATYDSAAAGEPLGMRHLRTATDREYRKLGRRAPAL